MGGPLGTVWRLDSSIVRLRQPPAADKRNLVVLWAREIGPNVPWMVIWPGSERKAVRGHDSLRLRHAGTGRAGTRRHDRGRGHDVDLADAGAIIELMRRSPRPGVVVQLRVLGGAMARVAPDATAFAQRDAGVMVAAMALFEGDAAPHDAWTEAFFAAFSGKATGVYANFLGAEGDERIRAAYPNGAYERLARIKRHYDPTNLFRRNQNVAPTGQPSQVGA